MSKTMKEMIIRDYQARLNGQTDAAVISIRGVPAIETTKLRQTLRAKGIKLTVVRNNLARKAFEGGSLAGLDPVLEGSSTLVYGGGSIVEVTREIIKAIAGLPAIELKGAVLDGQLYRGKAGVEELSKFPTRAEALGQTVTLLLGPARTLMGQVKGPGSKIAGIVKAIEEKLEKGETIAKVG